MREVGFGNKMSWVLFEERMADISPDNFQWAIKCTIQFMGCVCVCLGGGGGGAENNDVFLLSLQF